MTPLTYEQIKQLLRVRLSADKYKHSLGVADTARQLAQHYCIDENKAYLAGLVHDYAKNLPPETLKALAETHDLYTDPWEHVIPEILHAPAGAFLVEQDLGIHDADILQAVRYHSVGAEQMSRLDEIIFVADMIEPNREYEDLPRLRREAYADLTACMLTAVDYSLRHCLETGKLIHPRSISVHNHYTIKLHAR
jgi:predicted HD superfamily hydrolase involved in NAD metabolism